MTFQVCGRDTQIIISVYLLNGGGVEGGLGGIGEVGTNWAEMRGSCILHTIVYEPKISTA